MRAFINGTLVAITFAFLPAQADDWPMWRGPHNNGLSAETNVPLTWSDSQNIAWKTAIPGSGYSSPICWGDRVFVTSADLKTKARTLFCIDRSSGRIVWRTVVAIAEIEEMHPDNSPASATPATDGKNVYVVFQTGSELLVAAYDFAGNQVWQQTPGQFESQHGFNTSPVIYDGSLLISGMQDGPDAFMAKLDCETGKLLWKSKINRPVRSFSTPLVIEADSVTQVVLSGASRTIAFDSNTGEQIWTVRGPAQKTVSSVSFGAGLLFVPGGRERRLFAIRPDGQGDVTDTHIAWTGTKGIPYVSSPLLYRGHLHVMSDDGVYTRYDAVSGRVRLQQRLTSAISSSLVGVDGRVYITDESGRTTVIAADPQAELQIPASNEIKERTCASLAISDGDIYIRGEHHLFRITDDVGEQ